MKYQDFSFLYKVISSPRAVKILFLSFKCEEIGVAMVTNMISQLQESFPRVVFYVEISSVSIKYTEHYTATRGYGFYRLVLKVSLRYFQHEEMNSYPQAAM